MEAWTDSLFDIGRFLRKPVHVWARNISEDLHKTERSGTLSASLITRASNNFALIVFLLGLHQLAQRACLRQIEFSKQHHPSAWIQPRINLIRLHWSAGNYKFARELIHELISDQAAVEDRNDLGDLVERICLHERFFLQLKLAGPKALSAQLDQASTNSRPLESMLLTLSAL